MINQSVSGYFPGASRILVCDAFRLSLGVFMPKRLVIGIGGTGLDVIRNLRRRIVEANPERGLAQYPSLGFLYIDTCLLYTSPSPRD